MRSTRCRNCCQFISTLTLITRRGQRAQQQFEEQQAIRSGPRGEVSVCLTSDFQIRSLILFNLSLTHSLNQSVRQSAKSAIYRAPDSFSDSFSRSTTRRRDVRLSVCPSVWSRDGIPDYLEFASPPSRIVSCDDATERFFSSLPKCVFVPPRASKL